MVTSLSYLNATCPFPEIVPCRRPPSASFSLGTEETTEEIVFQKPETRPPSISTITVFDPVSYDLPLDSYSLSRCSYTAHLSPESIARIHQFVLLYRPILESQVRQEGFSLVVTRKAFNLPRSLVFRSDGSVLVLLNRTKLSSERDRLLGCGTYKKVTLAVNVMNPEEVYASAGSKHPLSSENYTDFSGVPGTLKCFDSLRYIKEQPTQADPTAYPKTRLLLEFCNQKTLHHAIKDWLLLPLIKKSLFMGILLHIKTLHERSCVHRDLKPANILLHKDPHHNLIPKFGDIDSYAYTWDTEKLQKHTTTCTHASPEYAFYYLHSRYLLWSIDYPKLDVWSFGCCMYELFFGQKLPWNGGNEIKILTKLSQIQERWFSEPTLGTFEHLIWEALDPNPSTRTTSLELYQKALTLQA